MFSFLTFSPSSSHNFSLPAEECVALHGLVLVDGDEGEHVGEELVSAAVGDPGQGHGVRRPVGGVINQRYTGNIMVDVNTVTRY